MGVVYYFVHFKIFPSYQSAWLKVNFYSLLVQALQVVTSFLILTALQVDSQVVDYLFVFLVSCLAYVLPFVGARELAFVYGADLMGLDKELSITVSLFFYLSMALTSLSGLYFLFFPSRLK